MDVPAGHYAATAAEGETVRARVDGKPRDHRFRNKFARVPSQGASTMERVFTGVSGSQTGGQGVLDIALPELVQQGGSFSNWPLNLPPAGSQTMVPLN